MSELLVETSEGITLRYEIANAGSRAAAAFLDLVFFFVAWLILTLVAVLLTIGDPSGTSGFLLGLLLGGTILFLILYFVLFSILWEGQTPGKRILGIRAVDHQGYPAGALQHILRGLFWPLEAAFLLPAPFGLMLIAATEKRQRLGDMVAGTLVLREVETRTVADPFTREKWADLPNRHLPLTPALAARFDAEDVGLLRSLLGRYSFEPAARDRLLLRAAKHYAQALGPSVSAPSSAQDAEALLHELYLFLRDTRSAQSSPA